MRINLTGGSLQPRSPVLAVQKCINLYPEPINPDSGEPIQWACYPRGGLKKIYQSTQNFNRPVRGMYKTSQGQLIVCIGTEVIRVNADFSVDVIGYIQDGVTQVRMCDNTLTLFIVDGNPNNGWFCPMPTNSNPNFGELQKISDPAFYGSQTISILDTFFLFTKPNSNHWYCSLSNFINDKPYDPGAGEDGTAFYGLYIASKTSKPDYIIAVESVGQLIYVFGRETTEIWYDAGGQYFPFQRMEQVMIGYGVLAPYTVTVLNNKVFWVGRDFKGYASVCVAEGTQATKISPFWLERLIQEYDSLEETIAYAYQLNGHNFLQLTFKNGKVWCFDADLNLWHERCSVDANGDPTQFRAQAFQTCYNTVFAGDYQLGILYEHSHTYTTDNGAPILYERSFPHVVMDSKMVRHNSFTLDMQNEAATQVNLSWSDDRGKTFFQGATLQYDGNGANWAKLWQLGVSRDRVYNISWLTSAQTALLGAFLEVEVFDA